MSQLLFIKAHPGNSQNSHTLRLAETFLQEYCAKHPHTEIVNLDLYAEDIRPLNGAQLGEMHSNKASPLLKYAHQFAQADRYVVAAPMWNLSIPAILKVYIDYVMMAGITFKYTEKGPVGLLSGKGKHAVHVSGRGGLYSAGPAATFEMGDKYLRTIFGFMGIESFDSLLVEQTAVLQGTALEENITKAHERARTLAQSF